MMESPTKSQQLVSWVCRFVAAIILAQTLFFKFTGAEESIYIFTKVGLEPWGRYASGVAELFAAVDLCGIKNSSLDTQNTLAQIAAIKRPIRMFTGHSFDFLKCLDGGAAGGICPIATLMPKTALALYGAHKRGDRAAAEAAQKHFYDALGIVLQEKTAAGEAWGTPHGGVKAALAAIGVIESARMRDPQPMPTDAKRREIAEIAAKVSEL